jgi:cytochrome c biogenesis protein CcmG/thiol:disulfide interchange protein DsbE
VPTASCAPSTRPPCSGPRRSSSSTSSRAAPGSPAISSRRSILVAILIAVATTAGVFWYVRSGGDGEARATIGGRAPAIVGETLDGDSFDLAAYAGRPVIINFWGPSCVPCRDEFPLLLDKLEEHAPDGLAIIGVLTDDPEQPARDFVAEFDASWPTVVDPGADLKRMYRVAGRPQTYFVDGAGIIQSIQIGEIRDADFERQYAKIAP